MTTIDRQIWEWMPKRKVREFIEQVFLAADDINAIEEGRQ